MIIVTKINFDGLRDKFHDQLTAQHYVGLDLETTGFSPAKFSEIIEFAAFRVDNPPEKWDKLYSLVKPKNSIPKKITKLTGITNDDVKDAPCFTHFAKELYTFVGDAYIVAHNADFEKRFLDFYMNYNQLMFTNEYIDTVELYKTAFPDRDSYRLDSFISEFGISNEKWHTAEADTYYTTLAFIELRKRYLEHFNIEDPIDYDIEDRLFNSEVWTVKGANYWTKDMGKKSAKERLYVKLKNPNGPGVANVYYDYILGGWDYNGSITRTPLDFSEITKQVLKLRRVSNLDELRGDNKTKIF